MRKRAVLSALALLGLGLYRYRRSLLARWLRLPPPRNGVSVKRNIPVVMPDGVRLFTDHYFPTAGGALSASDHPTILIRTPYGRGKEVGLWGGYFLAEMPAQRFAERGYHVIVQGARGCLDSEGDFNPHINEAADGQATVEWISQQPWFNGALATWGPSYLGYMQWATASGAPDVLKGMLVMVASAENFTVTHPDGAFGLETRLRWSQSVHGLNKMHRRPLREQLAGRVFGDGGERLEAAYNHLPLLEADTVAAGEPTSFYRDILTHDQPDDPFWMARDRGEAVSQVTAPVHLIGGWYDYYLRGTLRDYAALRAAGRQPYLTIGPWNHASADGMMAGLREGVTWFDAHLKGEGNLLRRKPVRIYVMGADEWRELDAFPPPARETRYYLQAEGGLATDPPHETSDASEPDRYCYDPADPTPALGGAILGRDGAGQVDNRPLEARPDVLCFTTSPLACDVEVIGTVRLELFCSSSLPTADFFGRLCAVAPDGCSTNLCDGLFRVKPDRTGAGGPALDTADCWKITVDMWATAHRFRAGHRLRLQVSSGAHPRWSRNLGTGEGLAEGVRMVVAQQAVYHDRARPSALVLPVIQGSRGLLSGIDTTVEREPDRV